MAPEPSNWPGMNGIDATRAIVQAHAAARVLALSMQKDGGYVREMLRAGAKGYLLKDSGKQDLLAAVRSVHSGKGWLSLGVSDAVIEDYRRHVTDPSTSCRRGSARCCG